MMVGLPGCGKSTYIEKELIRPDGWDIIDTDSYIETIAKDMGKTYNEIFLAAFPVSQKMMYLNLEESVKKHRNIIWDQTNLSFSGRYEKVSLFENLAQKYECRYTIEYILFWPNLGLSLERNNKRKEKQVPEKIIYRMYENMEIPDLTREYWVDRVTIIRS